MKAGAITLNKFEKVETDLARCLDLALDAISIGGCLDYKEQDELVQKMRSSIKEVEVFVRNLETDLKYEKRGA